MVATPICVLFAMAMFVLVVHVAIDSKARKKQLTNRAVAFAVTFLWVTFPIVNNYVFSMFSCEQFEHGQRLLRSDYSIDCDGTAHQQDKGVAVLMAVVYSVGIPAAMMAAMSTKRFC